MTVALRANDAIARVLRMQAGWCRKLDSELYATVLESAAENASAGGVVADVLAPYATDSAGSVLALRFLAAVHRIALRGDAPSLAACYPSCGGNGDRIHAPRAFLATVRKHSDELGIGAGLGVQTNEVNRCAALLGAFLLVAQRTGLPLRMFEIGASAGLNLRWDRFRYVARGWAWGPADARVVLRGNFATAPPSFADDVRIVERRGCDRSPIDPTTEAGRRMLVSFVWPDQAERLEGLERACNVAADVPAVVDRADALGWLESTPVFPVEGTATIVFHSVFAQYLPGADRERLRLRIATLASQASARAPFAYVFMEIPEFGARLRMWPGIESTLVAESSAHGREVRWLGIPRP